MPEQEFVSDTTGREAVQSDLRLVIHELKQAITQTLAERPRTTYVNMVADSGNQSQSTRGRSQTPGQRSTSPGRRSPSPEPESLSQTAIETKPVIEIDHLAPGTTEVDETTLLGHDKDMMDKTVVLDHSTSHLVLDEITTRGMDMTTNRLDHGMITGLRSAMGHRYQETSAWSTTMEISHATTRRRPLNEGMAHHQEMVHNGTSRNFSPSHLGSDDVKEIVGSVVRWDVIPGRPMLCPPKSWAGFRKIAMPTKFNNRRCQQPITDKYS